MIKPPGIAIYSSTKTTKKDTWVWLKIVNHRKTTAFGPSISQGSPFWVPLFDHHGHLWLRLPRLLARLCPASCACAASRSSGVTGTARPWGSERLGAEKTGRKVRREGAGRQTKPGWVRVKIKPGIGLQVLVHVAAFQGSIWGTYF